MSEGKMFEEYQETNEQQQQQEQQQQIGKATPKIDFPELRCSVHRSPVIIVCMNPDSTKRIFLCAHCITEQSGNLKDYEPLKPYNEFVQYIQKPSGLKNVPSEEAQSLVSSKNTNLNNFINHISDQKREISKTVNKLNDLYQDKCTELTESLQQQIEQEKDVFAKHYEKFQKEVEADKEKDASVPKFFEIKDKIKELGDNQQIEEYMRNVLRQKQQWDNASIQLRTLGKRTEDHYRGLIENHYQNKPSFSQSNPILTYWTEGLEKLINEVKKRANCFENLFTSTNGIEIHISKVEELGLLTNQMIKPDTELQVSFSGSKFTLELAQKAATAIKPFSSLRHLALDFTTCQVSEEPVSVFFEAVQTLTGLTNLSITGEGTKNKNVLALNFAKILPSFTELLNLKLNFAFSDIHDEAASALAQATGSLVKLTHLNVQLQYNSIKEAGALAWGNALQQLVQLQDLHLNLGGFSGTKNRIKDDGANAIAKALGFLTNLTKLYLDLGYNHIHTVFTQEFTFTLKKLINLSDINLQFYNNGFNEKGGKKVAKAVASIKSLRNVTLNFNNNELKKDGSKELINAFRSVDHISNLTIYLRNVGLGKEDGANYKNDLTFGKNYDTLNLYY